MRGVKSILAEKLMSFDWLWQMWRVNSRTAVWDYNAFVRTYWTNREAIGMSFSVSVTMIIISSFTETLCVALFHDSIVHTILWPDSRGRFVRSVQCKAVRRPRGLNFNIYLWILWQTGGSYSIVSHFFFFTKCSEKKTVTDPVKTQSDQISHFFAHWCSPPLPPPSPRIGFRMHYVQRRKARVRPGQERATYFDSDLTQVGCWHSAFLDKKDKTVTRLFELYWGTEFPPCVLVFFFLCCCILGLIKGQRSTRKKDKGRLYKANIQAS